MRKHLMIGGACAALATGLTGCVGPVPLGGDVVGGGRRDNCIRLRGDNCLCNRIRNICSA